MKKLFIIILFLLIVFSCGKFKPFTSDKVSTQAVNLKMKFDDKSFSKLREIQHLNGMIIRMHNLTFQEFFHSWNVVWTDTSLEVTILNAPIAKVKLELMLFVDDFSGDNTTFNLKLYYASPVLLDLTQDKEIFEVTINELPSDIQSKLYVGTIPFKICNLKTSVNAGTCTFVEDPNCARPITVSDVSLDCSATGVFGPNFENYLSNATVYYAGDLYGRYPITYENWTGAKSTGVLNNIMIPNSSLIGGCENVYNALEGGPPLKICLNIDGRIAFFNIDLSKICEAAISGKALFLNSDYITLLGNEIDLKNRFPNLDLIGCEDLPLFNRSLNLSQTIYDLLNTNQ